MTIVGVLEAAITYGACAACRPLMGWWPGCRPSGTLQTNTAKSLNVHQVWHFICLSKSHREAEGGSRDKDHWCMGSRWC